MGETLKKMARMVQKEFPQSKYTSCLNIVRLHYEEAKKDLPPMKSPEFKKTVVDRIIKLSGWTKPTATRVAVDELHPDECECMDCANERAETE